MPFQSQVNYQPAPGVIGEQASNNPTSTVVAGPGGIVAGAAGVTVGRFAWNAYAVAGGPAVANSFSPTAPAVPDGFVANEQQGLITVWLGESSLLVPQGYGVTLFDRGDFWTKNLYGETVIGQKVFANLFTGQIATAAAGSVITQSNGVSAVIASATAVAGTYTLTINTLTSGTIALGQLVTMAGIPPSTYIESIGTFDGTSGTVFLSQPVAVSKTAVAATTTASAGQGGAVVSSATADNGSTTITINTITSGALAVGQSVSGTGIASGTYIASLGTGSGGTGTYVLSAATTATITTAAVNFSGFIETPWYAKSAGNVGDLVKIGVKN